MSDLKLFRVSSSGVLPLSGGAVALEKSLQDIFEKNLEALLGVRFLASEFITEGGRMDSLGIDENGSPVIVEYKRSTNENVINQGLFYLNWLMGHRKDFEWLVLNRFGMDEVKKIDWSGPRLICIAGDFTRYDEHAVRQMNRNIDLIRYKKFEGDLLVLEQLTTTVTTSAAAPNASGESAKSKYTTVTEHMAYLTAQGDDVTVKTTDYYIAFRRMRNFVTVEFRLQLGKLLVYAKVDPESVTLEKGFSRNVKGVGHFGSGDLELTIASSADFEKAKSLLDRAYSES